MTDKGIEAPGCVHVLKKMVIF